MTAEAPALLELKARRPFPPRLGPKGNLIYKLITTTDHKLIGIMYCVACFAFFLIGGLMALFIRTELAVPGLQFLSNEQYNQLFTMHGTIMLLLYATPIVFGFANLVLPLQIGAPDVAFPRLNAFSFWLFLFGALIATAGDQMRNHVKISCSFSHSGSGYTQPDKTMARGTEVKKMRL